MTDLGFANSHWNFVYVGNSIKGVSVLVNGKIVEILADRISMIDALPEKIKEKIHKIR